MENTKIGKKLMALVLVLATMVAFAATAFAYDVNSAERYMTAAIMVLIFNIRYFLPCM